MAEINWRLAQTPDYFGGMIRAQEAGQARRAEEAKARAYMTYAQDPQAGIQEIMAVDPVAGAQLQNAEAQQARWAAQDARQARLDAQPKYIETAEGIFAIDPSTGASTLVQALRPKEPTAPSGFAWTDGGKALQYIPGGPGDPKVIGAAAQTRRDVVVNNPMPSRARSSGSASTGVPAGFVLD